MKKRLQDGKLIIGAYILKPYAQTETHIRDVAECGIDMIVCMEPKDRNVLDLFQKYGIGCILSGVFPHWWGGSKDAGAMSADYPLELYEETAAQFKNHPAVWGIDICDEPSVLDFEYCGRIIKTVQKKIGDVFLYMNLYPNYGIAGDNGNDTIKLRLGTPDYKEYIDTYTDKTPLPYISYDFYLYALEESDGIRKMTENFSIVAEACRKTGRRFWYTCQVNGINKTCPTSENMLRFQAYSAMAYGASVINWACYTGGWWENNVLDKNGNKTQQYAKLKKVNSELGSIGEIYMQYINVDTYLLGLKSKTYIDTDKIKNLKADKGRFTVGYMRHKTDAAQTALFIFNASDPYDKKPSKAKISFSALCGGIKIYGTDGEIPFVKQGEDYFFELESNRCALLAVK